MSPSQEAFWYAAYAAALWALIACAVGIGAGHGVLDRPATLAADGAPAEADRRWLERVGPPLETP